MSSKQGGISETPLDLERQERVKVYLLRMIHLTIACYIGNILVLFGFVYLNVIPLFIPFLFFLVGACDSASHYFAMDSRLSRRSKDLSLTFPHMIAVSIAHFFFLALAPQIGFMFLFNLLMLTVFGVLTLNVSQFAVIFFLDVAAVAGVFAVAGDRLEFHVSGPLAQALVWLHFSITLGVCVYINSLVVELRKRLSKTNRELRASFIHIEERTRELTEKNITLEDEIIVRKGAEQAVEQERDFSQALVQSIPEIFFLLGQEKRVLMYNPNALHQLAMSEDKPPVECPILDFVVEHDRERVEAMLNIVLAQGDGDCEASLLFTRSRVVPHYLVGHRVVINEILHVIVLGIDITVQRQTEEEMRHLALAAETANQAKSTFLANMSHEIRTPMNAVLGLTQLAIMTCVDARQHDYLEKINSSATRLLGILNDILDFSKIEAGQLDIQRIEFDISAVFQKVSDVVSLHAAAKNLELLYWVEPDVPKRLIGDPLRLEQVLLNLVSNAIKFTERGEVVIKLQLAHRTDDTAELICAVNDTGIGINAEQRSRLFHAFTQADNSTTRRFGGSGLGLVISQQLIKLMGGTIQVHSEPERGSTFVFSVVLAVGAVPDQAEVLAHAALAGRRVLLVDDNAKAREVLGAMLRAWSLQVRTAVSGVDALMLVRQAAECGEPFDLVLMDGRMPGLDGLETAQIIQQQGCALPIILMLTAYEGGELAEQARRMGAACVLVKPVENSVLFIALCMALNDREEYQAPVMAQPKSPLPAFAGVRILLVEDDKINQQVALELLSGLGVSVDIAGNGRLALRKILENANAYDVILTDIQMPEMDGLELTRQIRSQAGNAKLPIIALTAHAFSDERRRCLAAGLNDYITKPIDTSILRDTLQRWVPVRVQAQPGRLAAPSSAEHLPEQLPSFNLTAALLRLNGNRRLLRKLIVEFHDTYASAPGMLRKMLNAGEYEDLRHLNHTLKGVANTLEATEVAVAARDIECALHDRNFDVVPTLLVALEGALIPALGAASSLAASQAA